MSGPTTGESTGHRMVAWARLGRPMHLAGGVVFNGLGIASAHYLGAPVDWTAALWCQLAITATQVMTHYSNEYFDQDADAATVTRTRWAGGSGMLPEGRVSPRAALLTALIAGAIALVAAVVLATAVQAPAQMLFLFLLSLSLAWSYSSPPLWLNRRGLGEITGALLVPGLTTLLGFQVQAGHLALLPFLAVVAPCCFQFNMLLSVNFPDAAGDALVNKRTLVVIHGPAWTARLFLAVLALPYLLLPGLVLLGLPAAVALAVLAFSPIAVWQAIRIRRGAASDPTQWDALAFWSIGLLLATALLELAAFVALTWRG